MTLTLSGGMSARSKNVRLFTRKHSPQRNSNQMPASAPPQAPLHSRLGHPLGVLGRGQIRFTSQNAPLEPFKVFANDSGDKMLGVNILLYLLARRKDCDGIPLENSGYNCAYSAVLCEELGFSDPGIRQNLMEGLWWAGVFETPANLQSWQGIKLSEKAERLSTEWSSVLAQKLLTSPNHKKLIFDFLSRPFINGQGEFWTAGQILGHLLSKSAECDGETSPEGAASQYESRYWHELETGLHFSPADSDVRNEIMKTFANLGFFVKAPKSWAHTRISPLTEHIYQAWLDERRADSANGPKPEYVRGPVDLRTKTLQQILDLVPFPSATLPKIQEKLKALKGDALVEANKAKVWLNVFLGLPWVNETRDNTDADHADAILERNLSGRENLKSRLAAEIDVRHIAGNNRGGLIILVGQSGTGKSTVAKTVSEILGRRHVRVSLDGLSDIPKLIGNDRKNGLLVDAMIESESVNPVIELEIEREALTPKLLQSLRFVLDPRQSRTFVDPYLGVPFDLSKALFVVTAKRKEGFTSPMSSTALFFEFTSLLPEEKRDIAQKYLIPKYKKEFNLPDGKIRFEPSGLEHVIANHTWDAGVKMLEEQIRAVHVKAISLLRRSAMQASISVTPEWVRANVSAPVNHDLLSSEALVKGKAYSLLQYEDEVGLFPLQVLAFPGKGAVQLTGALAEAMLEPVKVALSFIKANATGLKLNEEVRDNLAHNRMTIHFHYPAVTKSNALKSDAETAALATFVSLWSALTQTPVPATVAVVGNMDLTGNVGKVDHLLDRVYAALFHGVKTLFLPKANEAEFLSLRERSEIFRKMTDSAKIKFVSSAVEVVSAIYERK